MDWNTGTKDRRILLRVTEQMERKVKALAELNFRTYQDELRFRIGIGLEHAQLSEGKVRPGPKRQLSSTGGNSRQQEGAA